jgi:hypothetical protein
MALPDTFSFFLVIPVIVSLSVVSSSLGRHDGFRVRNAVEDRAMCWKVAGLMVF